MRFLHHSLAPLACALFLTGCALTTEHVSLAYTPQAGVTAVPGANNVTVKVNVRDQRNEKGKVGAKKNGFGMEMAGIMATDDVARTVRTAIETELKSRGFALADSSARINIETEIIRFYNDFKVGFWAADAVAELNLSVAIKNKSGTEIYSKSIITKGVEENAMLMNGGNAKLALDKALGNGMRILFEDKDFISALLKSDK